MSSCLSLLSLLSLYLCPVGQCASVLFDIVCLSYPACHCHAGHTQVAMCPVGHSFMSCPKHPTFSLLQVTNSIAAQFPFCEISHLPKTKTSMATIIGSRLLTKEGSRKKTREVEFMVRGNGVGWMVCECVKKREGPGYGAGIDTVGGWGGGGVSKLPFPFLF